MPFIIIGMSIIGGVLVLWYKSDSDDSTAEPANTNSNNSSEKFDVERLRAARREIKKQTRLKNKNNNGGSTSGEEE